MRDANSSKYNWNMFWDYKIFQIILDETTK